MQVTCPMLPSTGGQGPTQNRSFSPCSASKTSTRSPIPVHERSLRRRRFSTDTPARPRQGATGSAICPMARSQSDLRPFIKNRSQRHELRIRYLQAHSPPRVGLKIARSWTDIKFSAPATSATDELERTVRGNVLLP